MVLIAYPSNVKFHNSNAQPVLKMVLSMYGKTTVFFSVFSKEKKHEELRKMFQKNYELLVESQKGKPILTDNVTKGNIVTFIL